MEKVKITKEMGNHKVGEVVEISSEYVSGLIKNGSVERVGTPKKTTKKFIKK
ncbi:hypothetical protein [Gluconacetobacter diazotrophicus]|uniref:hypothetical protein n=1 Tax=Gluconacetobacter diazotrophicus TaxID=33996 RepID=UPI001648B5AF|nr:hypothetical protein [Gluconacetobacter diazotrophicus]